MREGSDLTDVVRCPPKLISSRVGPMMTWFYSHLARLIYAEAQGWKPVSMSQLQEYVDDQRGSHYLEGDYGQYIMPNWKVFARESVLYADVTGHEDADPGWHSPLYRNGWDLFSEYLPSPYRVVCALEAVGAFTASGVIIHA